MITTLFSDLCEIVQEDEPMADHTSFGVGGPVRYFLEPRSWEELQLIYERGESAGLPVRILGGGSNTLVTDGPHSWVVISTRRLDWSRRYGSRIEVGAGLPLPKLVSMAEAWGLGGFEVLAGIPGSIGGAVAMNAGGRYGDVAKTLVGGIVAPPGQMPHWANAGELALRYRGSGFHDRRLFLFSALFDLRSVAPRHIQERRLSIVAEKRATQPVDSRSAGCVFKNPPGTTAGLLIDRAGLKGAQIGGAMVSHKHANFVVNRGNATADEILRLIALVAQRVQETSGVRLELEIEVWRDEETRS
jgi:UDP-N-acetylmuramate dehydrogenase